MSDRTVTEAELRRPPTAALVVMVMQIDLHVRAGSFGVEEAQRVWEAVVDQFFTERG